MVFILKIARAFYAKKEENIRKKRFRLSNSTPSADGSRLAAHPPVSINTKKISISIAARLDHLYYRNACAFRRGLRPVSISISVAMEKCRYARLLTRAFHRTNALVPSTGWFESTCADLRSHSGFCSWSASTLRSLPRSKQCDSCFEVFFMKFTRTSARSRVQNNSETMDNVAKTAACSLWITGGEKKNLNPSELHKQAQRRLDYLNTDFPYGQSSGLLKSNNVKRYRRWVGGKN